MKIIDLLNKIANGEIETYTKFVYNNKRMNIEYLIDNYLFLCVLNDEVKIINDKKILQFDKEKVEIGNSLLEKKKIPEKLNIEDDGNTITLFGEKENEWTILDNVDVIICNKINSIIDYLKSKGE